MSNERSKPKRNYFWPSVATAEDAMWASKQAFIAAIFCSAITTLVAILAIGGVEFVRETLQADGWELVDAAIFAIIAVFLRRHSRVAAWSALLIYVIEKLFMWATVPATMSNPVLPIAFTLAFLGGVRGTQALRRFRQTPLDEHGFMIEEKEPA